MCEDTPLTSLWWFFSLKVHLKLTVHTSARQQWEAGSSDGLDGEGHAGTTRLTAPAGVPRTFRPLAVTQSVPVLTAWQKAAASSSKPTKTTTLTQTVYSLAILSLREQNDVCFTNCLPVFLPFTPVSLWCVISVVFLTTSWLAYLLPSSFFLPLFMDRQLTQFTRQVLYSTCSCRADSNFMAISSTNIFKSISFHTCALVWKLRAWAADWECRLTLNITASLNYHIHVF